MGRTNPTFRDLLRGVEARWEPYRRALRPADRDRFDRLFGYARDHADAASHLNHDSPALPVVVSVLLAQERRIDTLESRLLDETTDERVGASAGDPTSDERMERVPHGPTSDGTAGDGTADEGTSDGTAGDGANDTQTTGDTQTTNDAQTTADTRTTNDAQTTADTQTTSDGTDGGETTREATSGPDNSETDTPPGEASGE